MKIGEIIKDSLKYPFSDWNKILILGILCVFSSTAGAKDIVSELGITNFTLIWFIFIIGPIIGCLTYGYLFRIIKSSLIDVRELPKFNTWHIMFKDGIKIFIISFVYAIPAFLILVFAILSFPSTLIKIESNPLAFIQIIFGQTGTLGYIALLYIIIIIPIILMAIAYMADNNSKLGPVFRFRELLNKITAIGWANILKWYLLSGIMLLFIFSIGLFVTDIFSSISHIIDLLIELLLTPYLLMYFFRSLALLYKSK
jgi:Protein of unknown function (DUF4013)